MNLLVSLGVVLVVVAAVWGLHRLCVLLEDRGYLYYRKSRGGGGTGASVFLEMDRIARPSVEHVIEVRNSQTKVELEKQDGE